MSPSRAAIPVLVLICGFAAGCFGGSRPQKQPGSALWLTADSGGLSAEAQSRLAALGLKEIYLEAADLVWSGASLKLSPLDRPAVPRQTPTTLVIRGQWLPGDRPPAALAATLLSELTALRSSVEKDGARVIGFHFEVEPEESSESLGKTLGRLRTLVGSTYFVSAGLRRDALEGVGAQAIADGVDYVVGTVYGQRPGENFDDSDAWDLDAVEAACQRLEALGRPYFTGAVTLGTALLRQRGAGNQLTTALSLGEVVAAKNLELKPGFVLQGIDRQVWEFVARGPARVGNWSLATGDSIRIVRTATPFLEEFRRRLAAGESAHRLGDVFYRLRRDDERLSLSVDNLADVLAPDAATPVLELSLTKVAAGGSRWVVRLQLANRSSESTDLAFFDSNFVQLEVAGATIGDTAPGGFQRFELLVDGEKGTMRAFREANTVRFYLPLLEEGHEVASGDVELKLTQRNPTLRLSASFLLADGKALTIEPREWQFEKP